MANYEKESFPVKATAKTITAGGTVLYSWKEQVVSPPDGLYTDLVSGRTGTNNAREKGNADLAVPFYATLDYEGAINGAPYYTFQDAALASWAALTSDTVQSISAPGGIILWGYAAQLMGWANTGSWGLTPFSPPVNVWLLFDPTDATSASAGLQGVPAALVSPDQTYVAQQKQFYLCVLLGKDASGKAIYGTHYGAANGVLPGVMTTMAQQFFDEKQFHGKGGSGFVALGNPTAAISGLKGGGPGTVRWNNGSGNDIWAAPSGTDSRFLLVMSSYSTTGESGLAVVDNAGTYRQGYSSLFTVAGVTFEFHGGIFTAGGGTTSGISGTFGG